jgi:hypothetical protein
MDAAEVRDFLIHLAVKERVTAAGDRLGDGRRPGASSGAT